MTLKRVLAVTLALLMVLSFAACGGKDKEPEVTEPTVSEALVDGEDLTPDEVSTEAVTEEMLTQEETTVLPEEPETEKVEETEAPVEETTEPASKTPTTKAEIVEFYKEAAAATDKAGVSTSNVMKLDNLDGGSGAVGRIISMLEPIVKSALDKNSSTDDHITGGYKNLTADDVASATATDDGQFTTVTINLKEQTDGFSADSRSGHVGHGISVLGDVQKAIDALNGVDVDPSEGNISLHYDNATINVKIDNESGKIVSGTWSYKTNASIDNVKIKIGILPATLNGANAVISQTITM